MSYVNCMAIPIGIDRIIVKPEEATSNGSYAFSVAKSDATTTQIPFVVSRISTRTLPVESEPFRFALNLQELNFLRKNRFLWWAGKYYVPCAAIKRSESLIKVLPSQPQLYPSVKRCINLEYADLENSKALIFQIFSKKIKCIEIDGINTWKKEDISEDELRSMVAKFNARRS